VARKGASYIVESYGEEGFMKMRLGGGGGIQNSGGGGGISFAGGGGGDGINAE